MKRALVPISAMALLVASCGGDEDEGAPDSAPAASETTAAVDSEPPSTAATTGAASTAPASTGAESSAPATSGPASTGEGAGSTAPPTSGGEAPAPSGDPIMVGVITALTGPLGVYGESVNEAAQYAIDEVNANGGVLGRPVEAVYSETDGTPEATLQGIERLVQQDGVGFVTGPITSAEVIALNPRLESLGVVFANMTSKSDQVTGEACSALSFQMTSSDGMDLAAMSSAIADSGATNWVSLANDFAIGYDSVASFTEAAEGAGQTVGEPLYAPLGTDDYGTYITQLQESDADALWVTLIGGDAATFMTQAAQFGLFDQFDIVMGTNTVTEPLFPALGDYVEGFTGPFSYYRDAVDTPENEAFVTGWEETYGDQPYFVDADVYTGLQTLFQGIEEAGTDDPVAVAEAMEGLEVDTIFGPATMRAEDHQLLRPTFVGEIVVTDGGLGWEVISQAEASATSPEPSPDCSL